MKSLDDTICKYINFNFFFSSRRRHTRWPRDWSSDVCSSDLSARSLSSVNAERSEKSKTCCSSVPCVNATVVDRSAAVRVSEPLSVSPVAVTVHVPSPSSVRSEEHTSELQSRGHLVCRLLLEKTHA